MTYPVSSWPQRHSRTNVDNESAAFYAGTQFRSFLELSIAAAGVFTVRMLRPIDIIIRRFSLEVSLGEIRCEIYRAATPAGTWGSALPVIGKCEFADRPIPYAPQCTLASGGTITGGTLYDLLHVKTSGATAQAFTIGASNMDQLGAPSGSIGYYKFSNPGNSAATGIFTIHWEELPVK